jgi:CRISPR system Cascade subunit CasE
MYLSKLVIDPAQPASFRTLARPYRLHQAVLAAFDPAGRGPGDVLFRVEPERPSDRVVMLVQSVPEPDWPRAFDRFFGPGHHQLRGYSPQLAAGDRLRFRLRANPTWKHEGKRRSVCVLERRLHGREGENPQPRSREEVLGEWLQRKLSAAGAALLGHQVVDEGLIRDIVARDGREERLEFHSVLFEGGLVVNDPELFRSALCRGIGSAKGFGFGLLSIARAG